MKNKLSSFKMFINKIGKPNFVLIIFVFSILVITGLYQTFSLYTTSSGVFMEDNLNKYQFVLNNMGDINDITIASKSVKNISITVTNKEDVELKYGLYYSSSDSLDKVSIGYLDYSKNPASGNISGKSDFVVSIKIVNYSSDDVTISLGVKYGLINGGDLSLLEGEHWFDLFNEGEFYEVEYQKKVVFTPSLSSCALNQNSYYFGKSYSFVSDNNTFKLEDSIECGNELVLGEEFFKTYPYICSWGNDLGPIMYSSFDCSTITEITSCDGECDGEHYIGNVYYPIIVSQ